MRGQRKLKGLLPQAATLKKMAMLALAGKAQATIARKTNPTPLSIETEELITRDRVRMVLPNREPAEAQPQIHRASMQE